MAPKIIKIGRKDDLSSIIKQIKSTKDREVIFEVEKGSPLSLSSEGMKLIKKTGEVLGKKVTIQTGDETSRIFAKKAGVLDGESQIKNTRTGSKAARPGRDIKSPGLGSTASRGGRFSDIVVPRRPVKNNVAPKIAAQSPVMSEVSEDGSRLEIEVEHSNTSRFSKIFILCLVVLVITVFGLAVLLPKADIRVFARSEPITRDFEIAVDRTVPTANRNTLQIPGIPVSKEISITKSFPTSGAKVSGSKTGGDVTIYNFTSNILKLNASTTSLMANGKKYVLVKSVSGLKPNGVPNTGIAIAAAEAGEDYNLPANTRLQIVNAALGNANVYAQNPQALGGGSTGTGTKILSQKDLDNATNSLLAAVVAQGEQDLSTANAVKIRLLDNAVKKEVLAKTANKDVGAEVDSFDMTMIARVSGMAFREDDVNIVVISKINEVLSSDKYLLEGKQKPFTGSFKSVDLANYKGVLEVHFETAAAYKVDAGNLPKILAGKNESEIKEILLSKPEIDNVEVKFWPAWFVHKAPKFNGKINISTVLSQN
ncbi:MAG TPA: hypothetical protein VF974_07890 [Patescibacteria group bacterium]